MGLFDWFRRVAAGGQPQHGGADDAAASPPPDGASAEIEGLDFYKAIEAHQRWKVRLAAYVRGESGEKLDWQVICLDDRCALGQWLHSGIAVPSAQTALFTRLIGEHAEFHRRAGEVVQSADAGQRDAALKLINNGDYARASHKVIATMSQLYLALAEAAGRRG